MHDFTHHMALLLVDLYIPSAQSLKEKRMVIKSLKDRIGGRYNVSVSQLDTDDKWQTATLGMVMIGNDKRYLDGCLPDILTFIEDSRSVEISGQDISFF